MGIEKTFSILALGGYSPASGEGHSEVALLSITTEPSAPFAKGSKYYNDTAKKIYTAIEDNTWTNATVADPVFGAYYTYSGKTYTWDGNSLEIFELEDYQLVKEKTNSYSSQSTTTYPSSKALYDGLASKIGIVDRELKLSDGDTIVVEVEDDSKTEIFSDAINISAYGNDSEEASVYMYGIKGAMIDVVTDTNQISIVTDSSGANITKTENNVTENVLWNKATGTSSISPLIATSGNGSYNFSNTALSGVGGVKIGYNSTLLGTNGVAVGKSTFSSNTGSIALGYGAEAFSSWSIAIGGSSSTSSNIEVEPPSEARSIANGNYAIQLGIGTNNNAKTLQVYEYQLLDGNTGKIPADRLSIPTPTVNWYTGNTGTTVTILDTSSANLVDVYKNGLLLQNLENYSISGTTLTLTDALEATDKICVKVDNTSSADLQAIQTLLSNI